MFTATSFRLACLVALGSGLLATPAWAQLSPAQRWQHLDLQADGVPGISADRAYRELLAGRVPTPVLVAVIDSGIDTAHQDLRAVLWRNPREVAGNHLDDDHNGYPDDVHGWNFLGNADGRNLAHETAEQTRLVAALGPLYAGKKRKSVPTAEQGQFDLYQRAQASYEHSRTSAQQSYDRLSKALAANSAVYEQVKSALQAPTLDSATLHQAALTHPEVRYVRPLYAFVHRNRFASAEAVLKELTGVVQHFRDRLDYAYNPAYQPRALVGDDLRNLTQADYGNPDAQGPDADHGTHCAGIIGAVRGNHLGVEGVADAVRIMSVRAVPDGDERDKDVANAIRYAVNNGAQIISMSFGKDFSPDWPTVAEAMRYADSKGVLLVHAAGTATRDLPPGGKTFPDCPYPTDGQLIPNLLTVGASSSTISQELVAPFSNYSKQRVDVFAPGVDIYSTVPGGGYALHSGTSMAAPVVAGVAAVLKEYFPQLTPAQLKQCIMQSAVPIHRIVRKPGTQEEVAFATLSRSGGIVNLYAAVQAAQALAAAK